MPAPAVRRATYQDVLDAPPNMIAEVILGTLHTQPRPAFANLNVISSLSALLWGRPVRGERGLDSWRILHWPELHLGAEPDILVPDLAGWHRERLHHLSDDAIRIDIAPNWVCEVLSASTYAIDRVEKMAIYLREQVQHLWLIDPSTQLLEGYRNDGSRWLHTAVHHSPGLVRIEPFESVELQLSWLWDR